MQPCPVQSLLLFFLCLIESFYKEIYSYCHSLPYMHLHSICKISPLQFRHEFLFPKCSFSISIWKGLTHLYDTFHMHIKPINGKVGTDDQIQVMVIMRTFNITEVDNVLVSVLRNPGVKYATMTWYYWSSAIGHTCPSAGIQSTSGYWKPRDGNIGVLFFLVLGKLMGVGKPVWQLCLFSFALSFSLFHQHIF